MQTEKGTLAVLGATGYIGGRLIPRLLEAGYRVRAIGRSSAKLRGRSWAAHPAVELATADVFQPEALAAALQGISVLYYLVHSMAPGKRRFRPARSRGRAQYRPGRGRGRGRADHLPGWPRRRPSRPEPAPAVPGGSRHAAAFRPGAGDGAAGGDDHRLGQRLLRDPALSRRTPAGHGHPALDQHPLSADRRAQCARLPDRLPRLPPKLSAPPSTSARRGSSPTAN